jgi:GT2 family glycosyltransferase
MLIDGHKKPAASVVIPAYNSASTLPEVLESVVSQEADLPYEVIVVESSGDGAAGIVRERFPGVQVIEPPKRLHPGPSRNLGAEAASGELLLFLDSDCVPERRWIAKMRKTHEEWDCAAVAGTILNGNPETPISVSSYMNEFSHWFPFGEPRYVDYLPSGNLSYKMSVFRKHGGFPPEETMYEDLIFNKLLHRAGEKLLFNPDIQVAHSHRTELKEYLAHEFRRGCGAAAARRRGLLIGASWVRCPALAFLAAPGLFARKAAVFPYRLLRAYPSELPGLLRALPYFYLALLVWHSGFLAEVMSGRRGAGKTERWTKS